MSKVTVESILNQIHQLPETEQARLRQLLEDKESSPAKRKDGLDLRVPAISVPDSASEMRWLSQHQREYAGRWVALDGDRLIAHGTDAGDVYAAAEADGAHLPLVTFIEDPDNRVTILWK
jgi:hypothetical protein